MAIWQTEELDEQLPMSLVEEELNLVHVTRMALGEKSDPIRESLGESKVVLIAVG